MVALRRVVPFRFPVLVSGGVAPFNHRLHARIPPGC